MEVQLPLANDQNIINRENATLNLHVRSTRYTNLSTSVQEYLAGWGSACSSSLAAGISRTFAILNGDPSQPMLVPVRHGTVSFAGELQNWC